MGQSVGVVVGGSGGSYNREILDSSLVGLVGGAVGGSEIGRHGGGIFKFKLNWAVVVVLNKKKACGAEGGRKQVMFPGLTHRLN